MENAISGKMLEGYGARSAGLGRAWLPAVRARRITKAPSALERNARHMRVEIRVGVCEDFRIAPAARGLLRCCRHIEKSDTFFHHENSTHSTRERNIRIIFAEKSDHALKK
ncbi:hypothetical protein [Burkholderia sp. Cy-637]|uniref:hypothetical protein n=1 Tax=Burkholderia sp. Cy-637 TaxID=2608327 RepID=UPI0014203F61|nr:hypothetical protein [Burkholderia sp. Cy-637]NIF90228.1 hypothetical protein [Burkholderia sp. Cy-637]